MPAMKERRWGRIVNTSSLAAKTGGLTAGTAYSVSKGALAALTFSLARELAGARRDRQRDRAGVRANADGHRAADEAQRQALLARFRSAASASPRSSRTRCASSRRRCRDSSPARSSTSTVACRWIDAAVADSPAPTDADYARRLAGSRPARQIAFVPGGNGGIGEAIAWGLGSPARALPSPGERSPRREALAAIPAARPARRDRRRDRRTFDREHPPCGRRTSRIATAASTCSSTASASSASSGTPRSARQRSTRSSRPTSRPRCSWPGRRAPPDRRRRPGRGGARQIHLLSVRAQLGLRDRGYSAYCATKGALVMLISQHAVELSAHGITVNGVAPTVVRHEMGRALARQPGDAPADHSRASRSAASRSRRMSSAPCFSSAARRRRSSPGRSSTSTAASPPPNDQRLFGQPPPIPD